MFNYFSAVKKDIRDWAMFEEVRISSLENSLFGIWDGFLYDGLTEKARELGVPEFLVYRLERVVNHIEKYMENGGELHEDDIHTINLGLV
jgi:hypothetical protein